MNEHAKSGIFAGTAVLLAVIASATSPSAPKSEAFNEQGQPFFPNFRDPVAAQSLSVVEWDAQDNTPRRFEVEFKNGKWTIPSHNGYPADAQTQLAEVSTSVVGIRKESIRSESREDHVTCGVVDPEDTGTDTRGRGRRVTLKDASGAVLADFIVGRKVDESGDRWFVRRPDEKRIYAARMNVKLSTRFSDWIETDLLQLDESKIREIDIRDYVVDPKTGPVGEPVQSLLTKSGDKWSMAGIDEANEEVNATTLGTMTRTLGDLKIAGVRRKPAGLSQELKTSDGIEVNEEDIEDLIARGFYLLRGGGLVSQAGELRVTCDDGVIYQMFFGLGFKASADETSSGTRKEPVDPAKPPAMQENRFLMIMAFHDPDKVSRDTPPAKPRSPYRIEMRPLTIDRIENREKERVKQHEAAMKTWKESIEKADRERLTRSEEGAKRAKSLMLRFADWYYVIGEDSYPLIHLARTALIKGKGKPAGPEPPPGHESPFPDDGDHDHDH